MVGRRSRGAVPASLRRPPARQEPRPAIRRAQGRAGSPLPAAGVLTLSGRLARKPVPHPNGVQRTSPGQRPGKKAQKRSCALQGRRQPGSYVSITILRNMRSPSTRPIYGRESLPACRVIRRLTTSRSAWSACSLLPLSNAGDARNPANHPAPRSFRSSRSDVFEVKPSTSSPLEVRTFFRQACAQAGPHAVGVALESPLWLMSKLQGRAVPCPPPNW